MDHQRGDDPDVLLHVRLRQDEDGWPPYSSEELIGEHVGDHLYALRTAPMFAFGLARGDVVRAGHYGDEQVLWVEELVEESGHSTVRIIPLQNAEIAGLISAIEGLGGIVTGTAIPGMVTVDVPPDVSFEEVRALLTESRDAGQSDFSVGVQSGTHAEGPRQRGSIPAASSGRS